MIEVALPGARVAFTTREQGDVREAEGLTAVEVLAGRTLARGAQVHGAAVRTVTEPTPELEEGDGQVTARDDVAVMVQVADCLPIAIAGRSTSDGPPAGSRPSAARTSSPTS